MYIIYRIIGIKVGLTVNFEKRCIQNKLMYGQDIIIEVLDTWPLSVGDRFAGDREWEWADAYGYERGSHYAEKNWNLILTKEQRSEYSSKGGKRASELGLTGFQKLTSEQQSNNAKASVASPNFVTKQGKSGLQTGAAQKASVASPNANWKQVFTCPWPECRITGQFITMKRWHFDNCKKKPQILICES